MIVLILSSLLAVPASPEPQALALFRQWSKSPSPELRIQAIRTLRGHDGDAVRAALLSMLADPHPGVRSALRDALVAWPPGPDLVPAIAVLRSRLARFEGLRALLLRGDDPGLLARDESPAIRARVLASGRAPPGAVRAALTDRDPCVRALGIECTADRTVSIGFTRDRAEEVRIAVARTVDSVDVLARLLRDSSWRVRLAAIGAAERLRIPALVPALIDALDRNTGRVQRRAVQTLERLTGAPFDRDARRWRAWWGRRPPGYVFPERKKRSRHGSRAGGGHSSAMVTFRRIPVASRRVCFVLDASSSMSKPAPGAGGKSRWELVVRDVHGVLDKLKTDTRFNVVLFRTGVEAWKPRLVPATRGSRKNCKAWIESAKPRGWTNLFDALALALRDDDVDALYVLTDGVPSRGSFTKRRAILDEIAYLNRYRLVQINCVQAGAEHGLAKNWRGFLEDLARAHDGVSVRE